MAGHDPHFVQDRRAFPLQEILDGLAEALVGDPVGAPGLDRQIAALDLVRPLGAGLDPAQPPLDGEVDGLVVAGLEMQEPDVGRAAPVAAEKGVRADEIERPGDRRAVCRRPDQRHPVRHALVQQPEEAAGQVGIAPLAVVGIGVEAVERVPVLAAQVAAGERPHVDAGRGDGGALLADRLALARGERAEKVVETAIVPVVPVILEGPAAQQAEIFGERRLGFRRESDVQVGDADAPGDAHQRVGQRALQVAPARPRRHQQARPGHRREGHGDDQLGIIAPAGPLVGVGPAPVEDVLALGMVLKIHRRDAEHRPGRILQHRMLGQPAGFRSDRAAFLQGVEKFP